MRRRKRTVYVVMSRERVQELREERGLSKRALADAAGVSAETVRRAEREEPVRFSTGHALAEALGVGPCPTLGRVLGRE
jgi:transcriptional regulator with XRE-family HTH domain